MLRTSRPLIAYLFAGLVLPSGLASLAQTKPHTPTKAHPPAAAHPQTTTKYYRYELSTRIGDNDYADEVPAPTSTGPSYEVVRDHLGRRMTETDMRDGKPTGTWKFHYTGTEPHSDSYETWINGELTENTKITRDSVGIIIRYDETTSQGDPTGHTIIQDFGDHQDTVHYDADNKPTVHRISWYSPAGLLVRRINYASATTEQVYTDVLIDEHTSHALSSKQMNGTELQNTKKWAWSADGELTRVDVYDDKGVWFSADEFEHGVSTRRLYKFTDGGTKEIRYSYNDKQWLTKSTMYHNDQLICTMTYSRLPDGTITRTLALAPDGTLMAEYPAPAVTDISANGQPPGRTDGVLHKTGNWW
jgi:antitoxin component YwqK of YwqJK toxin-antitoxin module